MIDFGLLLSVILAFGVPSLLSQRWPLRTFGADPSVSAASSSAASSGADPSGVGPQISFLDAVLGLAAVGVIVGRLAALVIDDPSAIGKLHDMLIIRSGVEFWPGALAAVAAAAWSARRQGVRVWVRLAALAPLSMVGYAVYEGSCVFRSGCAGPVSSIGLRPDGVGARVLPIGILMAVAIALGALVLRRWSVASSPRLLVIASLLVVAAVRSVGSFWLPKLGDELTRQHQTSLVMVGLALLALGGSALAERHQGG